MAGDAIDQHQPTDPLGVGPDELEGDLDPHGPAEEDGALLARVVQDRQGVTALVLDGHGVERGRGTAPIEPPVVPREEAMLLLEVPDLVLPGHPAPAEPVAQEDRRPLTGGVVRDLRLVEGGEAVLLDLDRLHGPRVTQAGAMGQSRISRIPKGGSSVGVRQLP